MHRLVIDIETVGKKFDDFDESFQNALTKYAKTDEERDEVKNSLGLYPLTGEIIVIGMLDPDTMKGYILYQDQGQGTPPSLEDNITYKTGTEAQILEQFWSTIKKCGQFVTFNGRTFDCPYILVRSAVHRLQPTKDLMPYRYAPDKHLDLLDQLTFYGATKRFSLDQWCRTFDIESPKLNGINGSNVHEYYNAGQCAKIARYCAQDLIATAKLLTVWERHIQYPPAKTPQSTMF